MREVKVRSWLELHDRLFADSWDSKLRRHRSRCVFRGNADAAFALTTSLSRVGKSYPAIETPLLRSFRRYAPKIEWEDSLWLWLAVAQHHGVPTRLLDWTFSPYVALHFVTQDPLAFDRDGVVWTVDYVAATRLLPDTLARLLEEEGATVFTADMLARAAPTLAEFDALAGDFAVFFEPPSIDDRIVNQHALFSVFPGARTSPQAWMNRHDELVQRIVVPAKLKAEVRDKLDQANVTERVLYPGLDGLAQWLTRYYSERRTRVATRTRPRSRVT